MCEIEKNGYIENEENHIAKKAMMIMIMQRNRSLITAKKAMTVKKQTMHNNS